MKYFFLILFITGLITANAFAGSSKILVNVDAQGIALQGYDPVAFFTDGKPVKGKTDIRFTYQKATYLFSTLEHKTVFAADPGKYAPQFGGFCAYGVGLGKTVPIEVDAYQIVGGKLLLQYDTDRRRILDR